MSIAGLLSIIIRTSTAAGVALPKPVEQAIADGEKVLNASNGIASSVEQLTAAVAIAVLADRDPGLDPEVQRLATRRQLGLTPTALNEWGEHRIRAALTEHADAIVETWRAASVTAGEVLAAAHETLGDTDLADTRAIVTRGPEAAGAWANAEGAIRLLNALTEGWYTLASITRFASDQNSTTLRLADLDVATFDAVGRNATAWEIVKAGGTIELATRDTYPQRIARGLNDRKAIQVAAERAAEVAGRSFDPNDHRRLTHGRA